MLSTSCYDHIIFLWCRGHTGRCCGRNWGGSAVACSKLINRVILVPFAYDVAPDPRASCLFLWLPGSSFVSQQTSFQISLSSCLPLIRCPGPYHSYMSMSASITGAMMSLLPFSRYLFCWRSCDLEIYIISLPASTSYSFLYYHTEHLKTIYTEPNSPRYQNIMGFFRSSGNFLSSKSKEHTAAVSKETNRT